MKNIISTAIICTALCLPASLTQAKGVNMNPGKWQMETTVINSFMSMPPSTTTECITKEEIAEDPLAKMSDESCTFTNKKVSKSSISFDMECSAEGASTKGHGDYKFNGNTFDGNIKMSMEMPPNMPAMPNMPEGAMTTTITIKGKHIGKCE